MMENVDFWQLEKDWHTQQHCSRVLLLALILAKLHNLKDSDVKALAMAAVFHDSRRQDDWLDVGHGQRAADYYRKYCSENNLFYDGRTYYIMAFHDRDDREGLSALKKQFPMNSNVSLLYKIFKDSDALDRFRIAPDALDIRYLRTYHASKLAGFSKKLVKKNPDSYFE